MADPEWTEALLRLVGSHQASDFSGPQPPGRVDAAENRLGVQLPASYRAFLLALGVGGIGRREIYGVFTDDFDHSSSPDVVWSTLHARKNYGLEPSGIVIGNADEELIVIDLGRMKVDGTAPIVWWAPEQILEASEVIAHDFSDYLADCLASADGRP